MISSLSGAMLCSVSWTRVEEGRRAHISALINSGRRISAFSRNHLGISKERRCSFVVEGTRASSNRELNGPSRSLRRSSTCTSSNSSSSLEPAKIATTSSWFEPSNSCPGPQTSSSRSGLLKAGTSESLLREKPSISRFRVSPCPDGKYSKALCATLGFRYCPRVLDKYVDQVREGAAACFHIFPIAPEEATERCHSFRCCVFLLLLQPTALTRSLRWKCHRVGNGSTVLLKAEVDGNRSKRKRSPQSRPLLRPDSQDRTFQLIGRQ